MSVNGRGPISQPSSSSDGSEPSVKEVGVAEATAPLASEAQVTM